MIGLWFDVLGVRSMPSPISSHWTASLLYYVDAGGSPGDGGECANGVVLGQVMTTGKQHEI